jgi:hypothetical protein
MVLHKSTVSDTLWNFLMTLMHQEELKDFRLVGGTSLSLQLGHRMSVDIDLFTDLLYDSIDFNTIDQLMKSLFPIVQEGSGGNNSMGKTYFVGISEENLVKIDLFYTDQFVYPVIDVEGIRISGKEEIAAMKLEIVGYGGRKKDFWDIHELVDHFSISDMISFHRKRHPYSHSKEHLISMMTNFESADDDFNPKCLRNKHWELIKLDFVELIKNEFHR